MSSWISDFRHAVRTLRRSPGFAVVAIATLAIGIGANAAIFSVLDAVLLQPLPFASPERLAMVGDRSPDGGSPNNVGFETYEDLRDQNRSFESLAVVRSWYPTLSVGAAAERLPAMRVSANFFPMLGVAPALGRGFLPEDDRPDSWRVILLSDGLWKRSFGGDPSVIGRVVRMNDQDYRIVGVMPRDFEELISWRYYQPAQLWAPVGYVRGMPSACRGCQHLKAVGRLKSGVTADQARADLDGVRRRLAAEYPSEYPTGRFEVAPLARVLTSGARAPLLVLIGAVAFVLLIACANVANLMLARSLGRSHEMAVRGALGASRGRLIQQLLAESFVLCAAGGAAGLALAIGLQTALVRLAPLSVPRLDRVALDFRVVAFAAAAALAAAMLSGWIPALRASAARLPGSLAANSRGSAGSRSSSRARRLLTGVELTLAVVLVAGAFLMLRSVARLLDAPYGFRTERVLTMAMSLVGDDYATDPAVAAFQDRALARVRAIPGVESAAFAGQIPLGGNGDSWGFHIAGRMAANPSEDPSLERYSVTPDYFRTMGIPLLKGRLVEESDRADAAPVLLVSASAARTLWPGADPLGERVRIGSADKGPWRTVVGVVGDVRHIDVAADSIPQMYLPQAQVTDSFLTLVVRAETSRTQNLIAPIRGAIRSLDPGVPLYDIATMDELVRRSAAPRRFVMLVLAAFAAAALALAAIGLYGVVSHSVARRTREIGIRMALGATPREVSRMILASGAAMVSAGIAAGLACAIGLMRLMRSVLYEVSPGDPAALGAAVALLSAVALAAHWLPARRAARVSPTVALRNE